MKKNVFVLDLCIIAVLKTPKNQKRKTLRTKWTRPIEFHFPGSSNAKKQAEAEANYYYFNELQWCIRKGTTFVLSDVFTSPPD